MSGAPFGCVGALLSVVRGGQDCSHRELKLPHVEFASM